MEEPPAKKREWPSTPGIPPQRSLTLVSHSIPFYWGSGLYPGSCLVPVYFQNQLYKVFCQEEALVGDLLLSLHSLLKKDLYNLYFIFPPTLYETRDALNRPVSEALEGRLAVENAEVKQSVELWCPGEDGNITDVNEEFDVDLNDFDDEGEKIVAFIDEYVHGAM